MGELTFFLGLQVKQRNDGIFINQDKYVTEILKKFGFSDVKTANTPMETHKPLLKDVDGEDIDEHLYRSMIGSLMYLTSSRPDIMFAVCACARFRVNPKISHLHAVKRIFRYLKGQPKLGLWYPKYSPFDLVAYTDSDYAGESLDRKSTIRGCQFLGCKLISWQCKKQTVVANSTTKAEYIAASNCCGKITVGVTTAEGIFENADFAEIVDFLNANPIKYALTISPTIYVSCIEQFWSTAKIKTVNNETHIHAKVEGKTLKISKSFVRRDLQFNDEDDETDTKEREDKMERAATTASSLEAKQDNGSGPRCQDTIIGDAEAQTRFETASKQSNDTPLSISTKTTQAKEIANLKKRVKKLERKKKSRTLGMNLFKIEFDANLDEAFEQVYDAKKDTIEEGKVQVSTTDMKVNTAEPVTTASAPVTTVSVSVSTASVNITTDELITIASEVVTTSEPSTPPTITTVFEDENLTITQTLVKIRSKKSKEKGVVMQEPSETNTRPIVPPQQLDPKDKGKGKMVEPEKPLKRKEQIKFDEEIAQKLQA
ncbi:hypothetical protein Tco_1136064 [Tanacetum coccineum]